MKAPRPQDMRLAEEAADWLTQLMEEPSASQRADFVAWLKRSPRHMEEFLLVSTTHRAFRQLDPQREIDLEALMSEAAIDVVPFPADASRKPGTSRIKAGAFTKRRWLAVAASAACVAILGGLGWHFSGLQGQNYSTHTGEQRAFRLEDGSLLHLNTRSRIKVSFSKTTREVELLEGEALFSVQHEASRPFKVRTRHAVVQAVGTQFNVYEHENGTRVTVVEGKVRVIDHTSKPILLVAGEEANVGSKVGIIRHGAADVATAIAWRQRRLAFHGASLNEVVDEFNRYNELQLRIEGDGKLERRITAVFNADEPDALLQFLEREPSVQLERRGEEVAIRVNRPGNVN